MSANGMTTIAYIIQEQDENFLKAPLEPYTRPGKTGNPAEALAFRSYDMAQRAAYGAYRNDVSYPLIIKRTITLEIGMSFLHSQARKGNPK